MTVYAPSDVQSITIPAERGGCGQPHAAGDLGPGERFIVDCPQCEPHIVGARTGWAHHPTGVSLTPDEIAEAEAAERTAVRERNMTWAHPERLAALYGGQAAGRTPTLLEQIAALAPDERAALAAMLTTPAGHAPVSEAEVVPVEDDPDSEEPAADDAEPARRRPGRPRRVE